MFRIKNDVITSAQQNVFDIERRINRIVFDDILELNEEDKVRIIEHLEIMTKFVQTNNKGLNP